MVAKDGNFIKILLRYCHFYKTGSRPKVKLVIDRNHAELHDFARRLIKGHLNGQKHWPSCTIKSLVLQVYRFYRNGHVNEFMMEFQSFASTGLWLGNEIFYLGKM